MERKDFVVFFLFGDIELSYSNVSSSTKAYVFALKYRELKYVSNSIFLNNLHVYFMYQQG